MSGALPTDENPEDEGEGEDGDTCYRVSVRGSGAYRVLGPGGKGWKERQRPASSAVSNFQ